MSQKSRISSICASVWIRPPAPLNFFNFRRFLLPTSTLEDFSSGSEDFSSISGCVEDFSSGSTSGAGMMGGNGSAGGLPASASGTGAGTSGCLKSTNFCRDGIGTGTITGFSIIRSTGFKTTGFICTCTTGTGSVLRSGSAGVGETGAGRSPVSGSRSSCGDCGRSGRSGSDLRPGSSEPPENPLCAVCLVRRSGRCP